MSQPKDESFRHITCESLTIKNFAGGNKVEISTNHKGGYICVYNNLGQSVAYIGINVNTGDGLVETYHPKVAPIPSLLDVKGQI